MTPEEQMALLVFIPFLLQHPEYQDAFWDILTAQSEGKIKI
jgi:hypothetical protein